jgi:hypothetical protein
MALPQQKEPSVNQVLELVHKLPPNEQEQIRQNLNSESWANRWSALVQKIDEQSKNLPPLTDDEIAEEVMAYRSEQKTKRAQSGN